MSCLKSLPCRKGTESRTRTPAKHVQKALMENLSDNRHDSWAASHIVWNDLEC